MIKHVKTNKEIVYPDYSSSFGGSINTVFRKEYSTKSHVSFTGICPGPSYRATYYRNIIIYEIFMICQGKEGKKNKKPAITIDNWLKSRTLYWSYHLTSSISSSLSKSKQIIFLLVHNQSYSEGQQLIACPFLMYVYRHPRYILFLWDLHRDRVH